MILSDASIRELAIQSGAISPYYEDQLQPASYDLKLDEILSDGKTYKFYYINPGEFILGSTFERIELPAHIVGRIEGKSSRARQGLIIHTAGFVDPGFRGTLTLEITNLSKEPVLLEAGMLIAQIAFTLLDWPAQRPYGSEGLGSHYQDQQGAQPAAL